MSLTDLRIDTIAALLCGLDDDEAQLVLRKWAEQKMKDGDTMTHLSLLTETALGQSVTDAIGCDAPEDEHEEELPIGPHEIFQALPGEYQGNPGVKKHVIAGKDWDDAATRLLAQQQGKVEAYYPVFRSGEEAWAHIKAETEKHRP